MDLVLREVETLTQQQTGKLMLNWERLYKVIDTPRIETYKLQTMDGIMIKKT